MGIPNIPGSELEKELQSGGDLYQRLASKYKLSIVQVKKLVLTYLYMVALLAHNNEHLSI